MSRPLKERRAAVAELLRSRRMEIEEATFAHVCNALPDEIDDEDVEYVVGLRAAVTAAVDYGLTGLEHGEDWPAPIPSAAIAQARRSARGGVGLDTVLLRYIAGHTLLEDFVMEEAERVFPGDGMALRQLRRTQAAHLGRLTASIADSYRHEIERAGHDVGQRLTQRVRKLLAGEPVDTADLSYNLDVWHVGVIATGPKAEQAVRRLAAEINRQPLLVSPSEDTVWAWFGDRQRLVVADVWRILLVRQGPDVSLTVGEPAKETTGFRLTHRQAQAALLVALRRPRPFTRYADVALLAFALRDETLARSLVEIYLSPLDSSRKGAPMLRQTLRAYFAAERNASSAAAALGLARHTVENHLRKVEEQLDRLLPTCLAELEVALHLEELLDAGGVDSPPGE